MTMMTTRDGNAFLGGNGVKAVLSPLRNRCVRIYKRNSGSITAALTLLLSPFAAANSAAGQEDPAPPRNRAEVASPTSISADRIAPTFRLSGDEVALPFVVIKGIPFVEATVNGVRGKMMLDTGAQRALTLNSNRIPLTHGKEAGAGLFGSGQRFSMRLHDSVAEVDVGGFSFRDVREVESQEAPMLEGITPDFSGWMGFNFWRGYALKMDYEKNIATFYRDEARSEGETPKFLVGETVLNAVHYEARKLPNIPLVKVRIGSHDFEGLFDTGNSGYIWLEPELRAQLISDGKLKPLRDDGDLMRLEGMKLDVGGVHAMSVEVLPSPFPAADPIGTSTPNVIAFGYSFLSQYKTVWDFAEKTIYLLEKN